MTSPEDREVEVGNDEFVHDVSLVCEPGDSEIVCEPGVPEMVSEPGDPDTVL